MRQRKLNQTDDVEKILTFNIEIQIIIRLSTSRERHKKEIKKVLKKYLKVVLSLSCLFSSYLFFSFFLNFLTKFDPQKNSKEIKK